MILKKGNKGDDVKKVQQVLKEQHFYTGIIDGDFGPKTEDAVKAFQRKNNLMIDGIVGPLTWSVMFKSTESSIKIEKAYINTHITHSIGRPIKYIAIHYTAGGSSKPGSAKAVRSVFLKRNASADFVVDDETIVQINPDLKNYYCWSVGDRKNIYSGGGQLYGKATNKNTISIEICSNLKSGTSASAANHPGWYFTDKALAKAQELVRYLMSVYNIPKENVVRHYDISGKMCPGIAGWNNATLYDVNGKVTSSKNNSNLWNLFKSKI